MSGESVASVRAGLLSGQLNHPTPEDLAAAVVSIVDSLAGSAPGARAPDPRSVRKVTWVLNEFRHFHHTRTIAVAWLKGRKIDPTIRKHHVQALIELGALEEAEKLLEEVLAQFEGSSDQQFLREKPEYRGLLGRIRKQQFVASKDANDLIAATDEYLAQYSARKMYWHGINVLALRVREALEKCPQRRGPTTTALAKSVLKIALRTHANPERDGQDHWPLATAAEASLALHVLTRKKEWCESAELWLYRFLHHPDTSPFSIESYFRQLREIWRGDPLENRTCADQLANIVDRYVRQTERRWSIDPSRVQSLLKDPETLERNFSQEKTFTVDVLKQMLRLCRNIGCVTNHVGIRCGTGFLMTGPSLGVDEPLVFVTNAHVIGDAGTGVVSAKQANVVFEIESAAKGHPVSHKVDRVLFTSKPGKLGEQLSSFEKLDVTIVALKSAPKRATGLTASDTLPQPSPKTKAFVLGHPKAGALQFSLHDSELLDIDDRGRLMHYRTPTEPGSSGSPVFDEDWKVVALHHAGAWKTPKLHGDGEYEANEGITLHAIREGLKSA